MLHPTVLELTEVTGKPKVRQDLPGLVLGSKILLAFQLQRKNGSRTEELKVDGEFRVTSVLVDARVHSGPPIQIVTVVATKTDPTWKAIKNPSQPRRKPAPTHFPRTRVV